jgi:hypothetical protein
MKQAGQWPLPAGKVPMLKACRRLGKVAAHVCSSRVAMEAPVP